MPWPVLLLSFIAFLISQASSFPQFPSVNYQDTTEKDDQLAALEATFDMCVCSVQRFHEAKRALTLLSRLAPLRDALRQDRQYELRPRWGAGGSERAPGPLRWGR